MYELIVLGLVPGTQIQINFEMWQHIAFGLCGMSMFWRVYRSRVVRSALITVFAAAEMRRKVHATAVR
jgi:uncharacterized protein (DUF983 family)